MNKKLKKKLEELNEDFLLNGIESYPTNKDLLKAVMPLLEEFYEAHGKDWDYAMFMLKRLLEGK